MTMDYAVVPAAIFTVPEIGSVGLREHQAAEQGTAVRVGRFPYRALGKAHAMGEITGLVKIIADAASDRVLGVHIIGAHAADLVHEGALVRLQLDCGFPLEALATAWACEDLDLRPGTDLVATLKATAIHLLPAETRP